MDDAPDRLPRHVAVIMDGNGRWARRQGRPRREGHVAGAESARALARACNDLGIPVLTLYAFSTENWNRPRTEVQFLMRHLRRFLVDRRQEFVENDIRLRAIGALDDLPGGVRRELDATVQATAHCKGLTLVVALSYGARREIAEAARSLARDAAAGLIDAESVDERALAARLYTADLPDPDLLIRTGAGRRARVSNFLLWQLSYAELYFTETLWPDFGREEFLAALRDYAARERRFGGLEPNEAPPSEDD